MGNVIIPASVRLHAARGALTDAYMFILAQASGTNDTELESTAAQLRAMADAIAEVLKNPATSLSGPRQDTDFDALRERMIATGLDKKLLSTTHQSKELNLAVRVAKVSLDHHAEKVSLDHHEEKVRLYCLALDAEGVLDGVSEHDTQLVVSALSSDAYRLSRDGAARSLRSRANDILADRDAPSNREIDWHDRAAVVRALNVAAEVVETW
jgi:hypothetical protein